MSHLVLKAVFRNGFNIDRLTSSMDLELGSKYDVILINDNYRFYKECITPYYSVERDCFVTKSKNILGYYHNDDFISLEDSHAKGRVGVLMRGLVRYTASADRDIVLPVTPSSEYQHDSGRVLTVIYNYFLPLSILKPKMRVIDLGGHRGLFSRYLAEIVPNCDLKLEIYEATSHYVDKLRGHLPNAEIFHNAVSGQDGDTFDMYEDPDTDLGNSGFAGGKLIESTTTMSLESIITRYSDEVDYLKINIEGGEMAALTSVRTETLRQCKIIYVSFHHFLYADNPDFTIEKINVLRDKIINAGFKSKICTDQPNYIFIRDDVESYF